MSTEADDIPDHIEIRANMAVNCTTGLVADDATRDLLVRRVASAMMQAIADAKTDERLAAVKYIRLSDLNNVGLPAPWTERVAREIIDGKHVK